MDKISSWLPYPIRSHIVSFLPMKDAIRSKILARRWRYVCSSLSNLKFDQIEYEKSNSEIRDFRDFVDVTLLSYSSSDIQRFSLKIKFDDPYIYARRVNAWISFALQHNVQILILWSVESSALLEKLLCSLFTCSTLRVFSLVGIPGLKWPTITKFPVLRSLRIGFITFDDENVIAKLFSSCTFPVLEELTVDHCIFESLDTLSISISSLKFLYLRCEDDYNVNLSNPALSQIFYCSFVQPTIRIENLLSLNDASFYLDVDSYSDYTARSSFDDTSSMILMGLRNVETLALGRGVIEDLARDRDLLVHLPPSYWNLKELNFEMFPTRNHYQVLILLLRHSPNLETLEVAVYDEVLERFASYVSNIKYI